MKGKDSIENAMMIVKFIYMKARARDFPKKRAWWTGKHPLRNSPRSIVVDEGKCPVMQHHRRAKHASRIVNDWRESQHCRLHPKSLPQLISVSMKLQFIAVESPSYRVA